MLDQTGKLLCICVPRREKWKEFGWCGKSVEEIMSLLVREEIPKYHPGDPGFVSSSSAQDQDRAAKEETAEEEAKKQIGEEGIEEVLNMRDMAV